MRAGAAAAAAAAAGSAALPSPPSAKSAGSGGAAGKSGTKRRRSPAAFNREADDWTCPDCAKHGHGGWEGFQGHMHLCPKSPALPARTNRFYT